MIFVDDGSHYIRTASTSVVQKYYGKSRTRHHTSYHQRHKVVALAKQFVEMSVGLLHNFLCHFEEECEGKGGIDGLGEEFPSEYLQCRHDEYGIDDKESVLHGESRGVEDNGSHTRDTSRHNFVWQQEYGKPKRI